MKYCTKCILNEHTPFISFDKKGECNYCYEQEIIQSNKKFGLYPKESDFKKILDRQRGKGKYDCILACSGGKDSVSALFVVKKLYHLNPLVITLSNQFLAEGMITNVQKAVNIMGLDWRLYHYNKIKKGFEYFLKSKFRKQISLCDACQLFVSPIKVAKKIAREENIKIIFTGSTMAQRVGSLTKNNMIPAHQKYSDRYRTVMDDLRKYLEQFHELKDILFDEKEYSAIVITSPWHYLDQEKLGVNSILDNLGWKQIKQSFPPKSTNCELSYLTGYLGRKYKIANYDITFSRLIRFNKLNRGEAMKKFLIQIPDSLINKILSKLNLNINKL
ncbi:hypothetical protein KKD57_05340 [Patescibacteria group bacterium]|nr:hypothetical protein [Patescibacteria group bacterium]